jgi:hypothetical protein
MLMLKGRLGERCHAIARLLREMHRSEISADILTCNAQVALKLWPGVVFMLCTCA